MEQEYKALSEEPTSKNTKQNIIQQQLLQQKQRQEFQTIFNKKSSALAEF